ncbi:hypothetical protein A2U01_0113336, partial [Trifolium medium]|nr:hypothetical protein [Trifolium medium]
MLPVNVSSEDKGKAVAYDHDPL